MSGRTEFLCKHLEKKFKLNATENLLLTLFLFVETCHLLITFVNSLHPDQARQNVGPGMDPECLTL